MGIGHGRGFWVVAAGFLLFMSYSTVPTPLYPLYERADRFPESVITVIFAAYAFGVMVSLYLAGHLSDRVGRRRILVIAALVAGASAVMFLIWQLDVAGLTLARLVNGMSIGLFTATATAYLGELRAAARPGESPVFAASIASAANLGGLALGPLIGGILAETLPAPLVVPHVVFLVLLLVIALVVMLVPETVVRPVSRVGYRPQRLSVPPAARSAFRSAAFGAFAGFAVFGLLSALTPTFLVDTFDEGDHLVAGAVTFAIFGASAFGQLALGALGLRTQLLLAAGACGAGLVGVGVGAVTSVLAVFIGGGVLAGLGVGILFKSAVATAGAVADPQRRGETLALLFLIAYSGVALPVLVLGAVLVVAPLVPVLVGFTALVLVATVRAALAMRRRGVTTVPG
ncbi:MFS transporter [Agromyces aerolatus]|uniref:MFS transporter n=1 Tax=Agromyces sp. LY-1074 TaxID=3074080 RepID=UPI002858E3F2|nr:MULTISPECIES: MFS transporter [unclassified Agromyces]MDR5700151.1 MFS transporter [Agromyces sp. LY-1074]MDR5706481.1 MFS transporter [Agromyces sp. LY-1358]